MQRNLFGSNTIKSANRSRRRTTTNRIQECKREENFSFWCAENYQAIILNSNNVTVTVSFRSSRGKRIRCVCFAIIVCYVERKGKSRKNYFSSSAFFLGKTFRRKKRFSHGTNSHRSFPSNSCEQDNRKRQEQLFYIRITIFHPEYQTVSRPSFASAQP